MLNLLSLRCSPARGYRLPSSALINLSHGVRSEMGNQKLTAIVKPQPAVNNYNSYASDLTSVCSQKVRLGGLNHSPRSLFVPTQVRLYFHFYLDIHSFLCGSWIVTLDVILIGTEKWLLSCQCIRSKIVLILDKLIYSVIKGTRHSFLTIFCFIWIALAGFPKGKYSDQSIDAAAGFSK